MRIPIILLTLMLAIPAFAEPRQSLVPGGIAVINIENAPTQAFKFNNKPVLITEIGGGAHAIVGIPLSIKPGEHYIESRKNGSVTKKFFTVKDKQYSTQHITIKDKRKVNPYASDMDRILREKRKKSAARTHYSSGKVDIDFIVPVQGIQTGSYGRRRVFNGQAKRPHSGMDIAADEGTPILAPSAGKVIELGDFFFSGNLVYLDHGQGLISMFAHLSEIDVELNQILKKGQVLGKVGATGRVTGPHLHWSLGLNSNWIDPSLFLPETN